MLLERCDPQLMPLRGGPICETTWSTLSLRRRVVLFVTLDVRSAFNSVRCAHSWDTRKSSPCSRLPIVDIEGLFKGPCPTLRYRKIKITSGASIIGPDLWKVLYDNLLWLEIPDESYLVRYANYIAALVIARTVDRAQRTLGMVMQRLTDG